MIHKFRAWLQLRKHFLLDGEYVALIEIVKRGTAVALVRSPQCRWVWPLRVWIAIIKVIERDADYLTVRVVTPSRADILEAGFRDWMEQKFNAPKFSKQLSKWASAKARLRARRKDV